MKGQKLCWIDKNIWLTGSIFEDPDHLSEGLSHDEAYKLMHCARWVLSCLSPLFMEERRTYICSPPLFMEERRNYICPPFCGTANEQDHCLILWSSNYTAHPEEQLHPHAKFELDLWRTWRTDANLYPPERQLTKASEPSFDLEGGAKGQI